MSHDDKAKNGASRGSHKLRDWLSKPRQCQIIIKFYLRISFRFTLSIFSCVSAVIIMLIHCFKRLFLLYGYNGTRALIGC